MVKMVVELTVPDRIFEIFCASNPKDTEKRLKTFVERYAVSWGIEAKIIEMAEKSDKEV